MKRLKENVARRGITFDDDVCFHATRHTFAKHKLGGYGGHPPATVEIVAGLMGITRNVCWETYAKWCPAYVDPLWDFTH